MFTNNSNKFANTHSLSERIGESSRILKRYPDRIPVICENNSKDYSTPKIDKKKYLVPHDLTLAQFMYVIRKRIKLSSSDAIFLFVGDLNHTLPSQTSMIDTYNQFKSNDGFLYIIFSKENTFG